MTGPLLARLWGLSGIEVAQPSWSQKAGAPGNVEQLFAPACGDQLREPAGRANWLAEPPPDALKPWASAYSRLPHRRARRRMVLAPCFDWAWPHSVVGGPSGQPRRI